MAFGRLQIFSTTLRARDTNFGDFCDDTVCTCAVSTINSTSGREYLTENGFNHINFLYDVKILTRFRLFFAMFHCACAVATILLLPV